MRKFKFTHEIRPGRVWITQYASKKNSWVLNIRFYSVGDEEVFVSKFKNLEFDTTQLSLKNWCWI